MSAFRDHAFVTCSQVKFKKEDMVQFLREAEVELALIVLEKHQDGGEHIHAAISGSFRQRDFVRKLRKAVHKKCADHHVDVQYAHPPKKDKGRGMAWPLDDMVKYLTEPAKDKYVDADPLYVGAVNADDMIECHYHTKSATGQFNKLVEMRHARASLTAVIEFIQPSIDKNTAYLYRMMLDYYRNIQLPNPRLIPEGQSPRLWQQLAIAFALQPIVDNDTNNRGMWIHTPPGSGKSWLQDFLHDTVQGGVFYPGTRPSGHLDEVSFRGYAGEAVILIPDISASTRTVDGVTTPVWKRTVLDMLKKICDNTPLSIEFCGELKRVYIHAKIIITSNFRLPRGAVPEEDAAFTRRYIQVESTTDIAQQLQEVATPLPSSVAESMS